MKKTYINGMAAVSAQETYNSTFLEKVVLNQQDNVLTVKTPNYKDFILPIALRRMSKCVKNGIVASSLAMKEAEIETVDAIITGIGIGCIEDSEKFLKAILDNKEEYLTPISFIQSTHNTVATQIALGLQCKGYNFTYMNRAVSFESALIDAKMMIEENDANTVLIGGVDETSAASITLLQLAGFIKTESQEPKNILTPTSKGVVYGEGATFFVLQNDKQPNTLAEVLDVEIVNKLNANQLTDKLLTFLSANSLQSSDIDAVILGFNGDIEFDHYYKTITETILQTTPQVYYKHLSGEYNTASAFGLWIGAKIIETQHIPEIIKVNTLEKNAYKKILLYNQYRGFDHSFTIISDC